MSFFTNKQKNFIFKVAFLEAMALSLVVPSVTSSGEVALVLHIPHIESCGTGFPVINSCIPYCGGVNINCRCTIPIGGLTCTKHITFTPTFLQPPGVSTLLDMAPLSETINNTASADFFQLGNYGNAPVCASYPGCWANMPVAQTEIFGDTLGQHWLHISTIGFNQIDFIVNCISGSLSATATLQLQVSIDTATTWTNLGSTLNIQSANCPNGGLTTVAETGLFSLPSANQCDLNCSGVSGNELVFRIVGQNGNGVGDNPEFAFARILLKSQTTINNLITFNEQEISQTSADIQINVEYPLVASTVMQFVFVAVSCDNVPNNC